MIKEFKYYITSMERKILLNFQGSSGRIPANWMISIQTSVRRFPGVQMIAMLVYEHRALISNLARDV